MCVVHHPVRHGKDRYGKQRFKCRDCGRTWIDSAAEIRVNRISQEKEEQLRRLIAAGLSIREIREITGHGTTTISKRMPRVAETSIPRASSGHKLCDYCGSEINGEREFSRRTRRTKHKFCDNACYSAFYVALRANDQCKRCGMKRRQKLCAIFSRGYCQRCYGILLQFNFDKARADEYELNQQLKKEIASASRVKHQKHV